MSASIPYTVQSGETLQDIAKKLGIKDWTKLQEYHNAQAGSAQKTSATPYAGFNLLTPPQEEIYEMNGETPLPDPEEEQKNEEQKQDEEKKKEEEEKKDEQASKSEHDGKYFIVHNAKCICDQSVDKKKANLQVTSHSIIVLNDQEGKLAATEADKSFTPPMATFGKCLKKPMPGGGYYDCVLTPAPKWDKTYESTQVMGKNTLTEISELKCTMGGVITIATHGQTDAVSNAHADNTNPVELAMVNPAVEPPKKKEEYPVVTSISLTEVEDRPNFAKLDSKNKNEVVYLRRYEEVSFKANLKSGNKQLTSWMVYSDHQGKKDNRLFLREQIGVEFAQSFADFGKFRIEGYGKPKKAEFEKGKYDKCDPTCSIDVEVIQNTLLDIECTSADFTSRIDPSKNRKFRKGVPSVFKAKFFIQELTEQEKSKLTWSVQDGVGNTTTEGVQASGNTLTFTPVNSKAKYTVIAQYINENGEAIEKKISGETEGNAVLGISHGAEIVRPGTSMSFSVSKMKYKFGEDNSPYGLTSDESSQIKWNLNGVFIGTGKSMTIPGSSLMTPGKYVIEAYSITANATGKNGRDEEDDWRFEVKENDVVSFTLSGVPKLGKPITATVDKMIFADLLPNEIIHWSVASSKVTGKSITITPKVKGTLPVSCKINNRKGVQQTLNVVEAKITKGFWNDFGGSEISQAAWGQKVDFCVKGENIEGEEIELAIYDSDDMTGDDFGYSNTENKLKITGKDDKTFASHRIELSPKMKTRTTNSLSSEVKLYGKAKLLGFEKSILKDITPLEKTSKYLSVNDKKSVYRAIIGEQNGRARHNPVDYDVLSWTYANTTYPKGTKLIVKIFEDINWSIDKECKELQSTGTVAEDGSLAVQINWGKLKEAKQNKKTKKYYAVIYDEKENKLLDGSSSETLCNTILIPQSTLIKEASYTGAVTVGSEQVTQQANQNGVCECEAKVRAFMRMLRVKEDTVGDSGYEKIVGGKSFIKDHGRDWSTHPDISVYIKRIDNSSDAAGAYQMMGNTYTETRMKNYRKQYNITSFDPESQDKMCLIILKYFYQDDRYPSFYNTGNAQKDEWRKRFKNQQGDIIQFIIDDNFKRASLLASLCWASLPDSPYGQQSSTYTNEDVKNLYDKYLKEELTNTQSWNVHLKKGFLKEFGYGCCGDHVTIPTISTGSCKKCNKDHYDVAKPEHWIHQRPSECWQASIDILANYGLKNNSGYPQNRIIMADQSGNTLIAKDFQQGLDYIDSQLKSGKPIIVGLDDNLRKATYNSHKATEHFFVIVGSGCEEGKRYYRFFDVGSSKKEEGTAEKNKLFLLDNNLLQGKSYGGSHNYTVTEVRRNH
ncbi:MAG: PAAR-like protein [Chryseobacterium jejuense]|uniref:PAAR-like protein n=1 Tax=Chryseobacterium jejuense TaxID=445960 RepID=UPI003D09F069